MRHLTSVGGGWLRRFRAGWLRGLVALCAAGLFAGPLACEDNGDGESDFRPKKPEDFGDNDPAKVVCIGDSITDGHCAPAGAPYPSRLGGIVGKRVVNAGACGEQSSGGASRIGSLLNSQKPGYVCILYGANDITYGHSVQTTVNNVRSMVQAAKARKVFPIVGTVMPGYDEHAYINNKAPDISAALRQMAKEEGAGLADLNAAFGSDRSLLQQDGLHPSDSGTQLIAGTFAGEF